MTGDSANRPLAGCTVLVTRARHQAAGLAEPLEALGAVVIVAPVIETVDPSDWSPFDAAVAELGSYDWLVFTSANAVERFFMRLRSTGVSAETISGPRVAAVGPATAEALARLGVPPDLVPADYRAEGLIDAFRAMNAGTGWRVLLPRAEKAREILPDTLREFGITVDVVPVYRTVPASPDPSLVERLRGGGVDVVTFTSPSTVEHFMSWLRAAGLDPESVMSTLRAASIGPVTSKALRSAGFVAIEAADSTMPGLVAAIVASGEAC